MLAFKASTELCWKAAAYRSPVLGVGVTNKGWRPSEKYLKVASFPYCLQTVGFPLLGLTHSLKLPNWPLCLQIGENINPHMQKVSSRRVSNWWRIKRWVWWTWASQTDKWLLFCLSFFINYLIDLFICVCALQNRDRIVFKSHQEKKGTLRVLLSSGSTDLSLQMSVHHFSSMANSWWEVSV